VYFLAAIVAWDGVLRVAQRTEVPNEEPVRFVERFLKATLGPDAQRRWDFRIVGWGRFDLWKYHRFEVQLSEDAFVDTSTPEAYSKVALIASCEVRSDNRVWTIHMDGKLFHAAENRALTEHVAAHRGWTLSAIRQEIVNRGARSINDAADATARLPLKEWEALFGPLRVRDVRFRVPDPRESVHGDFLEVYWEFVIDGSRPKQAYRVLSEPFGGRVRLWAMVDQGFSIR
jgi:hypothetical protein